MSGGTIAFILGFYDRFLDALHSLFGRNADAWRAAVRYLLKLGAGWVIGMGACVLALSKLFEAHIYFMSSLFLGLTLASFPFVIRAEQKALRGQVRNVPFAVFGLLLVEEVDRKEFLTELIQAMEPELPAPKRRRKPDAFSL